MRLGALTLLFPFERISQLACRLQVNLLFSDILKTNEREKHCNTSGRKEFIVRKYIRCLLKAQRGRSLAKNKCVKAR